MTKSTIHPEELAKFTAMADAWWDPEGDFKPLHKFNPARIRYIRDALAAHFGRDATQEHPFAGLSLLDIGCGGGLLSEPMARMGFAVTGIDAGEKNVRIAANHAKRSGLSIHYREATPESLQETFDVVLNMEVVEHVADPDLFLKSACACLKPGGLMVAATMNRTFKALALAKFGAEYILRWLPPGTHDWRKFLKPSELAGGLRAGGLEVREIKGMSYNPLADQWSVSDDLDVNYVMLAERKAA
ncbi:MAG: bifunctional 3-demethylubiquinol 3-O-methyltransferase/2-polyprenyl-6-hydroxyphenol methylase [Alphaproteobacteria bacterium RIFOXYD12_FULL_60_8]|nr:MAG: bifunctional 3-demethylubiquinol 3-O-methyltransferase/2-polyprenyl-6-hydroxyphenol methylase [Alphaproteobacteria bacterium RIFOXYD12_FULL_60_8]